jgi:uncharacterized repeat protein (TIGR03847 family)
MPRQVFDYELPDRFIVGTVGEPGERVFYLQAVDGPRTTSVVVEKEQTVILAERLDALMVEMARRGVADVPDTYAIGDLDLEPLTAPVVDEFRAGTLALGWNGDSDLIIVEAHAQQESEDDVPELNEDSDVGPDVLRVRMTPAAARAFAERARRVVSAGRPPCPFCLEPLNPRGHICPRANGYRR